MTILHAAILIHETGHALQAHSLLSNFLQFIRLQMLNSNGPLVDDSGTPVSVGISANNLSSLAAPGISGYNIMLGTGLTPVDIEDYDLETQIPHGAGAGQLLYGQATMGSVIRPDNSVAFSISRPFTNTSGADIDAYELGFKAYAGVGTLRFLIFRDVRSPP